MYSGSNLNNRVNTRVARRYIATWYINVGSVAPGAIPMYIESVKESLSNSHEDPIDDLREMLQAPVCGYWIPIREGKTHLDIQEFTFLEEEEEIDYDEEI